MSALLSVRLKKEELSFSLSRINCGRDGCEKFGPDQLFAPELNGFSRAGEKGREEKNGCQNFEMGH